jgi:flagellar biosynthetic protein FliR
MTAAWVTAGLIFVRCNGFLLTLPVFSTIGMPRHVVVMIGFALTALIAPLTPVIEAEPTMSVLVLGVVGELFLGASLGLVVRAVFSSLTVAAEVLGMQTAMGMAASLDPIMRNSQAPLGIVASWLAGLIFLSGNLHLHLLVLVSESFTMVPPGHLGGIKPLTSALVDATEVAIVLGFQLSGPLVAMVFLVNVFIGILSRLAPKMNVFFSVGMTLNSVVGIWLFGIALPWLLSAHDARLRLAVRTVAELVLAVR